MYGPFRTRHVVALATPMTALDSLPTLDLWSHCGFRGMADSLKHGERCISNDISLPPPSLYHYLPFFIYTFCFLYSLSLILHSSYALSFLSHVPLTCIPSYLLNFLVVTYFFSQLTTWEQSPWEANIPSADQEIPSTVRNPQGSLPFNPLKAFSNLNYT
jgi:hypothetical protein